MRLAKDTLNIVITKNANVCELVDPENCSMFERKPSRRGTVLVESDR